VRVRNWPRIGVARLGIDHARYPYRIVRLQPKGSFFLASLEGEGRVRLEGRWQRVTAGSLCMAPPRVLNALYAPPGKPWVFAWVLYEEPPAVKPLVGAASPMRIRQGAAELGRVIQGFHDEWEGGARPGAGASLDQPRARARAPQCTGVADGFTVGRTLGRGVAGAEFRLETHHTGAARSRERRAHAAAQPARTRRTPMEHVGHMRIQRAQKLLETTDWKLEAIAAEVGYHSGDVFTRAFVRYVGMTPSQYRVRQQGAVSFKRSAVSL
jgi:hypothetical protein